MCRDAGSSHRRDPRAGRRDARGGPSMPGRTVPPPPGPRSVQYGSLGDMACSASWQPASRQLGRAPAALVSSGGARFAPLDNVQPIEKGAAPHRAAPPHLYFGITRVFYVAFGQLRFYVWTRSVASFINPTRCTYRKTLASALARSYRVSVARKAGPNPAISSVFTGLASFAGRFVGSDDVLCYSAFSTTRSPLFHVILAFRERFGDAGRRHEPHVARQKVGELAA